MSAQGREISRVSVLWLALALVAIAVLGLRLHLNFDLSVFFPQKTNLTHDILLEQLKKILKLHFFVIQILSQLTVDDEQLELHQPM